MARWETCKIEDVKVREYKQKSGLLSTHTILVTRWEAKVHESAGSRVIYQSKEVSDDMDDLDNWDNYYELYEKEYQKMIAKLSSEVWEPAADDRGRITLMKRQLPDQDVKSNANQTSLIQQLSNLRDAGILTEEEFQLKKAEILKRI